MRHGLDLSTTGRANRRRLRVFLGTLVAALAISLAYTWLRPAEYRASARVEIAPGSASAPSATAAGAAPESARPFLTEVQVLTSRPVLELVATRIQRTGQSPAAFGPDPVAGMQGAVQATPVAGTNVVELVATGRDATLLAPLVNSIVDVYVERLAESYRSQSSESMTQANEEVAKLEAIVTTKRRNVEAFRLRYNIVSLERDENQVLAQVRNLSTSLSSANEKAAAAEGKLRALNETVAAGNSVTRQRDDPTLANLEQRASQAREEMRELERTYTQDYLAREPKAVALRTRLAELERQIAVQREVSQKAAVVEARDELASATGAVARLQSQIAAGRQDVGQFTARYNEYKSQQDDLNELEKTYRDAVQRRAKLEASERARMPSAKVIEAASAPQEPWRPLYWRDTAISVGGSLFLALLAMWLVELFNRAEPQPSVVVVGPQPRGLLHEGTARALPSADAPFESLERSPPTLLPQQPKFPRELATDEVAALVGASDDSVRGALLLLLGGISASEVIGMRWSDVDLGRGLIHVRGDSPRDVALGERLRAWIGARGPVQGSDSLVSFAGRSATRDSIDAQVLAAAHDAGIENPAGVTPESLRHTYVAYLVRQGIRFADLTPLVGQLPAEVLGAYSALAPPGPRAARQRVDTMLPGTGTAVANPDA